MITKYAERGGRRTVLKEEEGEGEGKEGEGRTAGTEGNYEREREG